jgi:hypothetical protein
MRDELNPRVDDRNDDDRYRECHEDGLVSCYVCLPPDWPLEIGQGEYEEWMAEGCGICAICQSLVWGVGIDEDEIGCTNCGQHTVSGARESLRIEMIKINPLIGS